MAAVSGRISFWIAQANLTNLAYGLLQTPTNAMILQLLKKCRIVERVGSGLAVASRWRPWPPIMRIPASALAFHRTTGIAAWTPQLTPTRHPDGFDSTPASYRRRSRRFRVMHAAL